MLAFAKYEDKYRAATCPHVIAFWAYHRDQISVDEANRDLLTWSGEDHLLYVVLLDQTVIGFFHLGQRGVKIDWLEDLFIAETYRHQGYGQAALKYAQQVVLESGATSMYIEVVPRNVAAIQLYAKLGFDTLNTISMRCDFRAEKKPDQTAEIAGVRLWVDA